MKYIQKIVANLMDHNAIYQTVDFTQVKSGIKKPETWTQGDIL